VAALVAYVVFRRRSRQPDTAHESWETAVHDVDETAETVAPDNRLDDPISPELALVDSSIRERLAEEPVVLTPIDEPAPSASYTDDGDSTRRGGRRRLRVVVWAALFVLVAVAAAGVYVLRERPIDHGAKTAELPATTVPSTGATPTATTALGRAFAWAPAAHASSYDVAILRGGNVVYSQGTSEPHVVVPAHWRLDGRTMSLTAGRYEWFVWPVFRNGTTRRRGAAIVATTFDVG
jgi:hypothetical protein